MFTMTVECGLLSPETDRDILPVNESKHEISFDIRVLYVTNNKVMVIDSLILYLG